jgi:hypothetical protein
MKRNPIAEEAQRRVFRAAFDIAASLAIDLDGSIVLARRIVGEALQYANTRDAELEGQAVKVSALSAAED